jgi:hypothetical protein
MFLFRTITSSIIYNYIEMREGMGIPLKRYGELGRDQIFSLL